MAVSSVPTYISTRLSSTHSLPSLVRNSTPVLGFGDFMNATIATIGLNPSLREFYSAEGVQLTGSQQRLQTLPSTPLAILNDCLDYFLKGTHYSGWFGRFTPILSAMNSCYEGKAAHLACHLDLVQTATAPVWGKLPKVDQQHYLNAESAFLLEQLNNHKIEKVLLNGQSVVKFFEVITGITLTSSKHTGSAGQPFTFYSGQYTTPRGRVIEVRGWNWNIQSSPVKGGVPVADIAALC